MVETSGGALGDPQNTCNAISKFVFPCFAFNYILLFLSVLKPFNTRSASTVASALLMTMEELREEPAKKDTPAEEKCEKKKEHSKETIKEKEDVQESSKEAVKEKKRVISPEKKKVVGKKMKPSASPTKAVQREVLAPLTNR